MRIAIVESHELTRLGLKAAIQQRDGMEVVGSAANGDQGLSLFQATKPNLAIVVIDTENTIQIKGLAGDYAEIVGSAGLTDREIQILQLIVCGCSNGEIAEQLFVTVGTVKTHVRHILNKLCVNDRTHAAVLALRGGLIE